MAKSFKELGKKAEELREQGEEEKRKVQNCQARVASSASRVVAARRQLAAASETDEEGNPVGDVNHAQAQLSMAENHLAASQRALSDAQRDAERVRQQQSSHAQVMERHNRIERLNLEKLRRLQESDFGGNAALLAEGIAKRHNETEDARVALLRSMGIEATAEYVSEGPGGGDSYGWKGGGFSPIDTNGTALRYQGGHAEGLTSGGGIAAPVGGGLGGLGGPDPGRTAQEGPTEVQTMGAGEPEALENTAGRREEVPYEPVFGEETANLIGIDSFVEGQMVGGAPDPTVRRFGRPRTPNEILSDMKKSFRETWMNNFNADEWKSILPEKIYRERLELYRKGVAAVIGNEEASALTTADLEQLSRVQNHAYLSGCQLNERDIAELYHNAESHQGNFVTRQIECKMDWALQEKAHGLTETERYSVDTWRKLSVEERKDALRSLINDLNSAFGTDIPVEIDFFYERSARSGAYNRATNRICINEYAMDQPRSYGLTQTLIHEMRHAYQYQCVKNNRDALVSTQTIGIWADNMFNNYKSPGDGVTFEEYVTQPIEWDAKNFAKQYADIDGYVPVYEGSWS